MTRQLLYSKTTIPTVDDDTDAGYKVGDIWLDTTNDIIYQAIDVTAGAASWALLGGAALSDTEVLSASFSITAAAGTYEDTGLSISLPLPGTYVIMCDVRAIMVPNTGSGWYMTSKLYNNTIGADVANSERMLVRSNTAAAGLREATASMSMSITVTQATILKLYAQRAGAGTPTFTQSDIASDASGRTAMTYYKAG